MIKHHPLDRAQKKKHKSGTFYGFELVDSVTRLCAMNLLLHYIGGDLEEDAKVSDFRLADITPAILVEYRNNLSRESYSRAALC